MGKTKQPTKTQVQRAELNRVLDYNEAQLIGMQKKGWAQLTDHEVNVLENFLAISIGVMRACPPAYAVVAANNVVVRAKEAGKEVVEVNIDEAGKPQGTENVKLL